MRKLIVLALILICVSCSKFSTPKSAAENIFGTAAKAAQKGDVTGCIKAYEDHAVIRNVDGTYSSPPERYFENICGNSMSYLGRPVSIVTYTHYKTIFNDGKNATVRASGKTGSDTLNMIKSENGWVWLVQ